MALPLRNPDFERRYTNQEFLASPEFSGGYELLDGKLVENMPGFEHSWIAQRINRRITLFDPDEKLGTVLPEANFDLGPGWMPQPDLAFLVTGRIPTRHKGAVQEVPDLVVEVHSPHDLETKKRRKEAQDKIRKYQERRVRLIWAVNPEKKLVEIYHPEQATPVRILGLEDELDGEDIIPGFTMSVRILFE